MGTKNLVFRSCCSFHANGRWRLLQSVAVAVKRCLRHTSHLGCVPQAAAGSCILHCAVCMGFRPSRDTVLFSSLCFLRPSSLSVACYPWTTKQCTPPCTTATLLSRPLSCSLPGLPTTGCCECSRHWGMCLSLLPWSFLSHSSASSCFGWA